MQAIITIGCSASGKSTWAKTMPEFYEINRDNIRLKILDDKGIKFTDNMWKHWNWKDEKIVTLMVDSEIDFAFKHGLDIAITDTNLNKERREQLKVKLESMGWDVEYKVFGEDLTLDELWKRDNSRLHTVGHSVIAKQYQEFRKQFPKFQLKDATNLRPCVIFDVDGTLTTGPNNRSAFDWDKVGQDLPNVHTIMALKAHYDMGYKIIILSGRDSVCQQETIHWLDSHLDYINYDLFMRPQGDTRKDTIIKQELFFEHIDGKYKVECVWDDRPVVIRDVWMEFGFKTVCVGNPYVDF